MLHFSDTPTSQSAKSLHLPDVQASAPAPKFENSTPVDAAASSATKTATPAQTQPKTTEREAPTQLTLTMLNPVHDQTIRSIFIAQSQNRKHQHGSDNEFHSKSAKDS